MKKIMLAVAVGAIAVRQVMSHPEEIAVEHAFHSIEHTENALQTAEERQEHLDTVEQNKQKLSITNTIKQHEKQVME